MNRDRTERALILVPPEDPYRYPPQFRDQRNYFRSAADYTIECERCGGGAYVQHHHGNYYLQQQLAYARGEHEKAPLFICFACTTPAIEEEAINANHVIVERRDHNGSLISYDHVELP